MITYLGEQMTFIPLDTPEAPVLTRRGTASDNTIGYKVVAVRSTGHSEASEEATVEDGPDTLSTSAYIEVKPHYVHGATSFDIYRTTGGADQGKIGSLVARNAGTTQVGIFRDRGQVAAEGEAPDTNTTGVLYLSGLDEGTLLMVGAGGALEVVAAGTEGQVLTMVSGTPTWSTP
jgi:hypothetical protein